MGTVCPMTRVPTLKGSATPPEEEVKNHQQKDQTDPATTVIAHARAHIKPASPKQEEKDNENQN